MALCSNGRGACLARRGLRVRLPSSPPKDARALDDLERNAMKHLIITSPSTAQDLRSQAAGQESCVLGGRI